MDKRITLLKPDTIPDGQGGQEPNPENQGGYLKAAEVWADMQNPKIRTYVINDGLANEIMRDIWIRYYPDIKLGWRVECGGNIYDVLQAYSEKKIKTVITCREIVR